MRAQSVASTSFLVSMILSSHATWTGIERYSQTAFHNTCCLLQRRRERTKYAYRSLLTPVELSIFGMATEIPAASACNLLQKALKNSLRSSTVTSTLPAFDWIEKGASVDHLLER